MNDLDEKIDDHIIKLAKAERNRYSREWRARNKEKVKEYQLKHWAKLALERAEREKEADNEQG